MKHMKTFSKDTRFLFVYWFLYDVLYLWCYYLDWPSFCIVKYRTVASMCITVCVYCVQRVNKMLQTLVRFVFSHFISSAAVPCLCRSLNAHIHIGHNYEVYCQSVNIYMHEEIVNLIHVTCHLTVQNNFKIILKSLPTNSIVSHGS